MLLLVYCEEGKAFSDFDLYYEAERIVNDYAKYKQTGKGDYFVNFCTDNIVNALRVALLRAQFDHLDVQFVFEGEKIGLDRHYSLDHWPKGFCDYNLEFSTELLKARVLDDEALE